MSTVLYYRIKCDALEDFYMWMEHGCEYDIAAHQTMYNYDAESDIETLVLQVTLAYRFVVADKQMSENFLRTVSHTLQRYERGDMELRGLDGDDIDSLDQEIYEIRGWLAKQP